MIPQTREGRPGYHVAFYNQPVLDKKASAEGGRPIYKDVPYVDIQWPGDRTRRVQAPAAERTMLAVASPGDRASYRMNYIERFPEQWEAFTRSGVGQVVGTPFEVVPNIISAAQARTLREQNVHTIEQLAEVPDRALPSIGMHARSLRDAARKWLDATTESASVTRIMDENASLKDRIARMEALMAERQATEAPKDEGQELGPGADFDAWEPDAIRAFLGDAGVQVDRRWSKGKLVSKAREMVIQAKSE